MERDDSATYNDPPLIEEMRAIRKAIEDRFDGDIDRLGEYLRTVGDEYRAASNTAQEPKSIEPA